MKRTNPSLKQRLTTCKTDKTRLTLRIRDQSLERKWLTQITGTRRAGQRYLCQSTRSKPTRRFTATKPRFTLDIQPPRTSSTPKRMQPDASRHRSNTALRMASFSVDKNSHLCLERKKAARRKLLHSKLHRSKRRSYSRWLKRPNPSVCPTPARSVDSGKWQRFRGPNHETNLSSWIKSH